MVKSDSRELIALNTTKRSTFEIDGRNLFENMAFARGCLVKCNVAWLYEIAGPLPIGSTTRLHETREMCTATRDCFEQRGFHLEKNNGGVGFFF